MSYYIYIFGVEYVDALLGDALSRIEEVILGLELVLRNTEAANTVAVVTDCTSCKYQLMI